MNWLRKGNNEEGEDDGQANIVTNLSLRLLGDYCEEEEEVRHGDSKVGESMMAIVDDP